MANFKTYNYSQMMMIPVNLEDQLQPGTLEFAIHHVIESHIDMSIFEQRYHNDETGRPAYDPKILLKVILLCYARGINTSRKIEAACRENIICLSLSCGQVPDYSTIATFISSIDQQIEKVFQDVLLICDQQNLLGGTCFAIDGCKLPSNASKSKSGTLQQLRLKRDRLQAKLSRIIKNHQQADAQEQISGIQQTTDRKREDKVQEIEKTIARINRFLDQATPKPGYKKEELKSNMTDNDSAQMKTSHGTIQGYNAQALVDSKCQIIVSATAVGRGQDHDNLGIVLKNAKANMRAIGKSDEIFRGKQLLADANYHSENNLKVCAAEKLDAYIPDNSFRSRNPRMGSLEQIQQGSIQRKFTAADFIYNQQKHICTCPAGYRLKSKGKKKKGQACYLIFAADEKQCSSCPFRRRCLESEKSQRRYLYLYSDYQARLFALEMLQKLDREDSKSIYDQRITIIEPVFGNIRGQKRLDRFTLRGQTKVNIQWLLYSLIHNIEKIANYGVSFA